MLVIPCIMFWCIETEVMSQHPYVYLHADGSRVMFILNSEYNS